MYKSKNIDIILSKMQLILNGHSTNPQDIQVKQFLDCANDLFKKWANTFTTGYLNSINENQFWEIFIEFLRECRNGSWSQMARHENEIEKYKSQLFQLVKDLIANSTDLGTVLNLIKDATFSGRSNKIKGLSPFILTGIMFASDQNSFMILDQPVLDFFTTDAQDALTLQTYQNILNISQAYAKKYKLSMWHVNKAYGILGNNNQMPVKKLCNQCFPKSFKVFDYPF